MQDFILLTGNRHNLENIRDHLRKAFHCPPDSALPVIAQADQTGVACLAFELDQKNGTVKNTNTPTEAIGLVAIGSVQQNLNSSLYEKNASIPAYSDGTKPQHDLIHAAYQKWGGNMAHHLTGQFSYCVRDPKTGGIQGALSPFNSSLLFVFQFQGLTAVTTDARLLKHIPGVKFTPNKSSLACWLAGQPDPHAPMFEELTAIPPGHSFSILNGRLALEKFWDVDPNAQIRFAQTTEYEHHFLTLLQATVEEHLLNAEGTVFSQMSGGMDSTSVSYLTAKICRERNLPFHTISHQYPEKANCDESDLIQLMIDRIKPAGAHFIDINELNRSLSFSERYPTDFNNPGIVHAPQYIEELELLNTHGASTLFTGNGGDEICWGHSSVYTSRFMRGDVKVVPEVFRSSKELNVSFTRTAYRLFLKPFLPGFLLNTANLLRGKTPQSDWPAWLTPTAVDAASASVNQNDYFVNPYSKRFNPAKFARYQSLHRTSTYNSLRSYQHLAKAYGIEVCHPFFHPKVIEFSFAIPEKLLIQGKYPKWLLRRSMNGHLPDEVCWKQTKVVFDQHFASLVRQNADELISLLSHEGLQGLGLIDNTRVLKAFNEILTDPGKHLNVDLLYVILTQSWYQTHCL
ncbi:asparagine synthetase B family protein [Reinekea marinisedimentorum]|uniref:asparagine synthase (glutamine-hydrolyzing) n=1 Tax=Reinekea marinisedimentorum TaxID=230495 RepID=A0A4R3HVN6_9GAMM|nr:asparagine synthetase B family protein [Reinekea marinisedimentorum]TCS37158.1 asparagine synthase [Reinekea marinisedimentorum]